MRRWRLAGQSMPEATAHKTGFGALAVFANRVVNSVRHSLERTAIARELAALSDRELVDIGLGRSRHSGGRREERDRCRLSRACSPPLARWCMTSWSRRSPCGTSVASPSARSTRWTTGCSPTSASAAAEIGDVVKGLHKSVSYPAVSLDLVAPIAAWNRARQTANQLYKLEDRMLQDIGVVRGDIEWLASEVAHKAVGAANRNQPTRAA